MILCIIITVLLFLIFKWNVILFSCNALLNGKKIGCNKVGNRIMNFYAFMIFMLKTNKKIDKIYIQTYICVCVCLYIFFVVVLSIYILCLYIKYSFKRQKIGTRKLKMWRFLKTRKYKYKYKYIYINNY